MSAHAYELRHMMSSIFWRNFKKVRCGEWSQFYIFLNMPPTRVCADSSATFNIKKSVCTCGHIFTPKKGGPLSLRKSKLVAMIAIACRGFCTSVLFILLSVSSGG